MSDFYKYHGLGNDYIVIDPAKTKTLMTKENIELICHRNFGVGSDGILYGPTKNNGTPSLKIFNPDGSEAEKSGNGLRIFAQYMWDSKYITKDKFNILTKSGLVTAEKIASDIKIDMGEFSFKSRKVPTNITQEYSLSYPLTIQDKTFEINCVTIGNPHCVIVTDKSTQELARNYGPILEKHPLFPNKINVQFVQIIDRNNIKIEIWERGAGYTLASGSSSVASVCVSHNKDLVDTNVTVHMQGGKIRVQIENNRAFLTGPVSKIMEGNFSEELHKQLQGAKNEDRVLA